jgi:hypothetical protein
MICLLFLESHYLNKALPIQLLGTTYAAFAKQGQTTPHFKEISTGIEAELWIPSLH